MEHCCFLGIFPIFFDTFQQFFYVDKFLDTFPALIEKPFPWPEIMLVFYLKFRGNLISKRDQMQEHNRHCGLFD